MNLRELLSVVIPTRNRYERLVRTLQGLAAQEAAPEQVIVVDASDDFASTEGLRRKFRDNFGDFIVIRANQVGAASQRNEGVAEASGSLIGFCDDDIDFEANCLASLRRFLADHKEFAGVGATVVNQAPRSIGRLTQFILKLLDRKHVGPFDGSVVGPAINLYPLFDPNGPSYRQTEWLNLGMVIYHRPVLPIPPFEMAFVGYSFGEDLALSCRVALKAPLAVLRDARVFHDSQPGEHKHDEWRVASMAVTNRFYIATRILNKPPLATWFQLLAWHLFCAIANIGQDSLRSWLQRSCGAAQGLAGIAFRERVLGN